MPKVNKVEQLNSEPELETVKEVKAAKSSKQTEVTNDLSVPVYSLAGAADGTLKLPEEIFGGKVNKTLLAQAIRVYSTNLKTLSGSTKTRGQVQGSTVKIFKQKGTGNARHGSKRAPIFVGGGIVFGPKHRDLRLDLPTKMRKAALLSALSFKTADKAVIGLSGLDKASGKTKEFANVMKKVINNKKQLSALIVIDQRQDNVVRGVNNLEGIDVITAKNINAYEVIKHNLLLITKEAVAALATPTVEKAEK
jgi:large subunit ribosomal protein L4